MVRAEWLLAVQVEGVLVRLATERPAIGGNHGLGCGVGMPGMAERHGGLQDTGPTHLLQHVLKACVLLPEINSFPAPTLHEHRHSAVFDVDRV